MSFRDSSCASGCREGEGVVCKKWVGGRVERIRERERGGWGGGGKR